MAVEGSGGAPKPKDKDKDKDKPKGGGFLGAVGLAAGLNLGYEGARADEKQSSRSEYERVSSQKLTPYVPPRLPAPVPGLPAGAARAVQRNPELYMPREELIYGPEGDPRKPVGERGVPEIDNPRPERKVRKKRAFEMTREDYNRLSPEQRAAVDFNTMLVQARERDLNYDKTASKEEQERYRALVDEIFGEDGGSSTYAPETLAVLKELDYKPDPDSKLGDDLDDFLGLKMLIQEKDLGKIGKDQVLSLDNPVAGLLIDNLPGSQDTRSGLQTTMAIATQEMQEEMSRADKVLQSMPQWMNSRLTEASDPLGGREGELGLDNRYVGSNLQYNFDKLFQFLGDPDQDGKKIWDAALQEMSGPRIEAFRRLVEENVESVRYLDLASTGEARSPEEFLALIKRSGKKDGD